MSPITIIIIGGILLIIILIIGLVVTSGSERRLVEERLGQYIDEDRIAEDRAVKDSIVADWVSKRVERTSYGERIARDLARADVKLKVGEYFLLIGLFIFLGGLIAWFVGNRYPVSALIGAVGGAFVPRMYVRVQQRQRLRKFNEQLSDMLNLMVNGLRAGYSQMQALEAISKELPSPIADEFRRVVQEAQIGITLEAALENLLRRIPSDDLDFVITAINVQREVGGNLAEILDNISFTIRERVRIKGEIRTLTAQVRTSGQILSGVPFFLALAIWFMDPHYLISVYDYGGAICTAAIACLVLGLVGSGYVVMMRIADIEV